MLNIGVRKENTTKNGAEVWKWREAENANKLKSQFERSLIGKDMLKLNNCFPYLLIL